MAKGGDRKPATLREVAARAQVSRATAARALNGYGYAGSETVQRVREAAEWLGYRGNRVAQALRQGRMPIVGFIPGDLRNPFFARIAHDIDTALRQSGHSLLTASSDDSPAQERALLDNLRGLNVRGVVIAPAAEDGNDHLSRAALEGPLVLVDRAPPDVPADSVTVDNEGGARQAVDYLIDHGHRRIALIHDASPILTAQERRAGYALALAARGLAVDERLIAVSASAVEHAIDATLRLFGQSERPTALLTVDSLMTTGALIGLRSLGLRVPRDVSLVGFDDFDLATFTDPQITVVAQPLAQIGPSAVRMLLERIAGEAAPPRRVHFPTRLIARGSVALPR